ncbi:MAG: hypothetical protein R3Y16_02290 [Rikenellaceae bacterium]
MNDIFNLNRFVSYAKLHYYNRRGTYAILLAVALFFVITLCCNMNPFKMLKETIGSSKYIIASVRSTFYTAFFLVGAIFIGLFVEFSLSSFDKQSGGGCFTMKDMLIPVSTFERYIFVILNSTVVALSLYLVIFWIGSSLVERLYFFGEGSRVFIGLQNIWRSTDGIVAEGMHRVDIFSLSNIFSDIFRDVDEYASSVVIACIGLYSGVLSTLMWGKVTFQRFATFKNIAAHAALWFVLIWLFAEFFPAQIAASELSTPWHFRGQLYPSYTPLFINNIVVVNLLALVTLIYTIVYQWVFWRKLKSLSLSK